MARLLEKALRRSEAVDREALCIVAGQKGGSRSPQRSFPELTSRLPAGLVNTC